ncbi:MAG TPA: class I SAM-dependent methyltransferase [Candidatus Nanoarchaeia archaeon]|nr:class I SAM-dependent methyltransferase [Candidatus Nanoarchaeia archaeon]
MKKHVYRELYDLEKSYWWNVGRRKLAVQVLKPYFKEKKPTILDFGCGAGITMKEMERYGKVFGVDTSEESIKFCKMRNIRNVQKINGYEDIKYKNMDAVLLMDVLEHIEMENDALKKINSLLNKEGKLFITVPAYQFMWSYWDEEAHHYRRYSKKKLINVLEKNNFRIVRAGYFYSFLLPVAMVFRLVRSLLPKKKETSDFVRLPYIINWLLIRLSDFERNILKILPVPFGLSVFCLAQKKN